MPTRPDRTASSGSLEEGGGEVELNGPRVGTYDVTLTAALEG